MSEPWKQLQLLVTSTTSEAARTKLIQQIALLHPAQEETDVNVIVWDGTTPPHADASPHVRLYAATEVNMAYAQSPATIREWGRVWRVPNSQQVKERGVQRKGTRWLPMFVCVAESELVPNLCE